LDNVDHRSRGQSDYEDEEQAQSQRLAQALSYRFLPPDVVRFRPGGLAEPICQAGR
jgi:hypothetical protein